MKRASIISIGDELLQGSSVDTNSAWIAGALCRQGYLVDGIVTVPDEIDRIAAAFDDAARKSGLVIASGGLGPTPDDVTRAGLASAIGCEVIEDPAAVEWIVGVLAGRGATMLPLQRLMGERPASADWHPNARGLAPILSARLHDTPVWVLPGPPVEMRSGWLDHVAPTLSGPEQAGAWIGSVRCQGLFEADAAERLGTLLYRSNEIPLSTRISNWMFIATVYAPDQEQGRSVLEDVRDRLKPWSLELDDATLSAAIGRVLTDSGASVCTAESCTGGGIGGELVATAGSSGWYHGGVVTYTNESKSSELDVPAALFRPEGPGAVSAEVAKAMALGVRHRFGTDWSVSVTGVAGPGGGSVEKPVGTVWIGIDGPSGTEARRFRFTGDRTAVQRQTTLTAMQLLRLHVLGAAHEAMICTEWPQ